MQDYCHRFDNLVLNMGSYAPNKEYLTHKFVIGLKPNIRKDMLGKTFKDVKDAMSAACRMDNAMFTTDNLLDSAQHSDSGSNDQMDLGNMHTQHSKNTRG